MSKAKKELSQAEVKTIIARLPMAVRASVVCALVGHSRIVTGCFFYVYCGRCDAQIADQLMGSYEQAEQSVRVGHNCPTCRKNYKKLDWKDKLLSPDPFKKPKKAEAAR